MERELEQRTAVVTGAGSAIGQAVALGLGAAGARVVAVGRDVTKLERTVAAVTRAGGEGTALAADVGDPAWLGGLAAVAPTIDLIVHGACPERDFAPLEAADPGRARDQLDVGLGGALALAAHALPGMKERGFGRLLFLGSVVGSVGGHGQAAYAAAKAGLVGLTRSLALEAGAHGVTVNLLELGLIDTDRTRQALGDDARARLVAATPAGRIGSPADVARAVCFLASPDAGFITGAVLPVTGGLGLGLLPPERPLA